MERLPSEILAYIIKMGSRDDVLLPHTSSQVCRNWRHVLLNTPTVWTGIYLDHRIAMWSRFLNRSKGAPLEVYLHEPPPGRHWSNWDHNLVRWILQPALPHVRRFRAFHVRLHTPAPFLWNSILSPLCGDSRVAAPMLEELTLIYPSNEDGKQFALFGGQAPKLRIVTLNSIRLACPSIFQHLGDLRYTHMCSTDVHGISDIVSILQACISLQHLKLVFDVRNRTSAPFPVYYDGSNHVRLVHLRHLQLSILGQDIPFEMELFLHHVEFTNVVILHCAHAAIRRPRPFPSVAHYAARLGPLHYLKELKVERGWVDQRFIFNVAAKAARLAKVDVFVNDRAPICISVPDHVSRTQYWLKREEISWA
jgi:hypothetical protein